MKSISCFFTLFFLLFICFTTSFSKPFTALVLDGDSSEPLIGASVLISGTTLSTVTDYHGIFSLEIPENTTEIQISYMCSWGTPTIIPYCGQTIGLIIIESGERIVCYASSGKQCCFPDNQEQLSSKLLDYYFPFIESRSVLSSIPDSYHPITPYNNRNDSISKPLVTGTVKDVETGEPLIGATILVMKTNIGTVTDFDGTYSLHLPPNGEKLSFRYTGYQTHEIEVDLNKQDQVIDVLLKNKTEEVGLICFPPSIYQSTQLTANQLPGLHYTHPYQWLRGQLPGLIVSQAGNDPWATPVLRQQGIHSLSQGAAPLWVVDGIPVIDPLLLSRQSINAIDIARRPVDLVQFGLQAGAGVIELKTQQDSYHKLEVSYQGQYSYERPVNLPAVATAAEFRQNANEIADLGFSTDWLQEVSRKAQSTDHQVNLSGNRKNLIWRTEGNYQHVQGVGRNSAWQQYSGRIFLQKSAWEDRLQLKLQAAGQRRWGTQDYLASFFFASKFNPTAPVKFDSPPADPFLNPLYETSSILLRNYFEIAPSLDYFNPVAIQNTSALFQQRASRWALAHSKLRINDQLNWQTSVSYQANDQEWGEENRTYALFRGNALANVPGAAQRRVLQNRQEYLQTSLLFEKPVNKGLWTMEASYHFQRFNTEDRRSSTQGFGTDSFTYQNFELFLSPQSELLQDNYGETHRLIGLQFNHNLSWKNINWRTTYQYQGSTLLGLNQRWFSQYASDLEVTLNELLQQYNGKTTLHAGYAKLGNLPTNKTYAQGVYDEDQETFVNNNPDLLAETRQLGQIGIRWDKQDWFATVDYYGSKTTDPIVSVLDINLPQTEYSGYGVNLNQLAIRNRTWEVVAGFRVGYPLKWESSISWAITRTYLKDTGEDGPDGFFDNNGQNTTFRSGALSFNWQSGTALIESDAPFGQLLGRQLNRNASLAEGRLIHFENFNGNHLPIPFEDIGVIGNALPIHSYSWKNKLSWKNWQLEWLIRGELGHDLAHLRRAELDPLVDNENLFLTAQNYLSTEYDLPGVKGVPVFSDHYIESGDYLSLDYVSISRNFRLGVARNHHLLLYISAQNLLLLTPYTGIDPSPRFVDEGKTINGSIPTLPARLGQLAPGIDRRYFYPRTQTITLGVSWNGL